MARDLDARSEAAIAYLLGLASVEERRAATALPWPKLLVAVRALVGCQRCGFVPTVVAAFCPELAAALNAPLLADSSGSSSGSSARSSASGGGPGPGSGAAEADPATELLFQGRSGGSVTSGLLAPAQLLALLDNGGGGGGGADLVSLLQFAWRDAAGANGAAASAAAGDVAAAPDQDAGAFGGRAGGGLGAASGVSGGDDGGGGLRRLALNDQLLGKGRLLRRFLTESRGAMEVGERGGGGAGVGPAGAGWVMALSEEVGDCRRHVGYPGPAELASTLARLGLQRAHTLERLAAWGVLRAPAPAPARAAAAADPAAAMAVAGQGRRQPARGRGTAGAAVAAADGAGGLAMGAGGAGDGEEVEEEADLELAVAIQLSLQEAAASAAAAATDGTLEMGIAEAQQTPTRGTPQAPSRAQRTPHTPAPARAQPASAAATPPGPGAADPGTEASGRSPAPPASGGRRAASGRPRPLGESVEGLAAYGLAVDPPWDGHSDSHSPGPDPRRLPSAGPAANLPSPQHPRHAAAMEAAGQPPAAAAPAPAAGLVSVSAAAAAAAGLEDASVLVDAVAVAALPPSLRERVEQLVSQLVQVQQRRARLQHACQHSIVAAGRKLLLLLLQQLWAELLRAADRAAAAALVTAGAEDDVGARDAPTSAGTAGGLVLELASAAPQRAASATERGWTRATAAAAAAGRVGGLTGASSAPSPLPAASQPGSLASASAAASASPGAATARRQPRYAGRLADLAEGLGDEDTHLDLDSLDPESDLNRNLDPGGGLGPPEVSDLESVLEDVVRLREREGRAGGGDRSGALGGSRSFPVDSYGYDDRRLQTWHGPSAPDGARGAGSDGDDLGEAGGWDDAPRVGASAHLRLSSTIGAFGGGSSAAARDALGNRLRQVSAPAPAPHRAGDGGLPGPSERAAATAAMMLSAALPAIGGYGGAAAAARRSVSVAMPSSSPAAAATTTAPAAGFGVDGPAGARPPLGSAARRSMAALWESTGLAGSSSSSSRAAGTAAAAADSEAGAAAGGERGSAPDREARISRILNRSSIAVSSGGGGMLGLCGGGGGSSGAACGCACVSARAEQAEQLRVLQGQLCRCQQSQSELQREVGRLLDQMAGTRRAAEQATAAVRRELAQWQGDAQALQGLGPEALTELAARMEAALSRVRGAALAAAAERDHQCPVCWEARKGLVFGCGHQTCVGCGEKLAACPICREPVALRIRVYG
ncbi:hypothetical protein HXX76_013253 [Chlamydomonas incerta]|uniref:RING-type domain-containing protein n=1 Tax=Chlamydomonas incerta TaxID=51695 RepID=A0A835SSX7_CHLIN|nr:hypothetical protein HXX76_013253 [Chlamydomonas incerta]|eukprot:KAG2426065.1 hypothetical protein HXX76_013253 [Chlamydomonas incerta]